LPQSGNLVFQLQLATFEFGDFEVVCGRVRHDLVDFVFECPVPLFQFRKRLHRHSGCLLNQWGLNDIL
jgi:hypothetical protein